MCIRIESIVGMGSIRDRRVNRQRKELFCCLGNSSEKFSVMNGGRKLVQFIVTFDYHWVSWLYSA